MGLVKGVKMTAEEVKILVAEGELNLTDVIDAVIEINGIIGVGLISLGEELNKYCRGKINKNITFD